MTTSGEATAIAEAVPAWRFQLPASRPHMRHARKLVNSQPLDCFGKPSNSSACIPVLHQMLGQGSDIATTTMPCLASAIAYQTSLSKTRMLHCASMANHAWGDCNSDPGSSKPTPRYALLGSTTRQWAPNRRWSLAWCILCCLVEGVIARVASEACEVCMGRVLSVSASAVCLRLRQDSHDDKLKLSECSLTCSRCSLPGHLSAQGFVSSPQEACSAPKAQASPWRHWRQCGCPKGLSQAAVPTPRTGPDSVSVRFTAQGSHGSGLLLPVRLRRS